ncbi:hypothetical protein IGI37_003641 [Enterococcus sp. AZ194]|uniref:hypothetical protein n=1 Tax=Enterococcus sp. AZ194 TaxID=2774629 RepID=UPI003F22D852
MTKTNEIVPIQIHTQPDQKQNQKVASAKLAARIKRKDGSEIHLYNGISSYILAAVLRELR